MYPPRLTGPSAAAADQSHADLVQRCLEGDATAWNTLVNVYWKRVFHLAYKFVADLDEAEDLTQEIFVTLFRALPTYDRRAGFDTWLMRVSRNLCIDHYRRRRRQEARFTNEVDPDTIALDERVSRPDAALERRDQVALVRRAMSHLPSAYREAVTLRDLQELSYEEIASRLRLADGTVKSRVSRGRKELARHVRDALRHQHGHARNSTSGALHQACR